MPEEDSQDKHADNRHFPVIIEILNNIFIFNVSSYHPAEIWYIENLAPFLVELAFGPPPFSKRNKTILMLRRAKNGDRFELFVEPFFKYQFITQVIQSTRNCRSVGCLRGGMGSQDI